MSGARRLVKKKACPSIVNAVTKEAITRRIDTPSGLMLLDGPSEWSSIGHS